jgi:hypothetical protein
LCAFGLIPRELPSRQEDLGGSLNGLSSRDLRVVAEGSRKALHRRRLVLVMVLRASPGRWGLACGLAEVFG